MTARRTIRQAALACSLMVLVVLGGAAPAGATDVFVDAAMTLQIADREGDSNTLDVRFTGLGYEIYDEFSVLAPGESCTRLSGEHHVVCLAPMVVKVSVDAGKGNDIVLLRSLPVPVVAQGGPGEDLLEGGKFEDVLDGGDGGDTIVGGAGADEISGNDGDDLLQGGEGGDQMFGGADADIVEGQGGDGNVLSGGDGRDLVKSGSGDDELKGGTGADVLVTGKGKDTATSGMGADEVFATAGDDVACGTAGATSQRCKAAPSDTKPTVWPPPPERSASAGKRRRTSARAAKFASSYKVARVRIAHIGNARRVIVTVNGPYNKKIPVRIRTYSKKKRKGKLKDFTVKVNTKQTAPSFGTRGFYERIRSFKVTCCGKK